MPLQLAAALLLQLADGLAQVLAGAGLELGDAHVAVARSRVRLFTLRTLMTSRVMVILKGRSADRHARP